MIFEVKKGAFAYPLRSPLKDECASPYLFRNIHFRVEQGEIMTILGANGAGKTTLVKAMMGILEWSEGATLLDNRPLSDWQQAEIWRHLAYVPQAKHSVFSYTVEEMVLLGRNSRLGLFRQPGPADRKIARTAMEEIGILHMKDHYCGQISGGELQMVLIARALCGEPKILILDEPESNLDFKNQLIILQTVKRLSKQRGISAIINTHFPEHALQISDYTLLVGKRTASHCFGPSKEILTEENLHETFDVDVYVRTLDLGGDRTHTCVIPYDDAPEYRKDA